MLAAIRAYLALGRYLDMRETLADRATIGRAFLQPGAYRRAADRIRAVRRVTRFWQDPADRATVGACVLALVALAGFVR